MNTGPDPKRQIKTYTLQILSKDYFTICLGLHMCYDGLEIHKVQKNRSDVGMW